MAPIANWLEWIMFLSLFVEAFGAHNELLDWQSTWDVSIFWISRWEKIHSSRYVDPFFFVSLFLCLDNARALSQDILHPHEWGPTFLEVQMCHFVLGSWPFHWSAENTFIRLYLSRPRTISVACWLELKYTTLATPQSSSHHCAQSCESSAMLIFTDVWLSSTV